MLELVAALVARLPRRALAAMGALLGFGAGTVLRIRRAHVDASLARAGLARGAAPRMYRSLGTAVFELLWLAGRAPSVLDDDALVTIDAASRARLDAAVARGRGVVIAASHTGNWDLAACAIARRVPLVVVTKRLRVAWLDAFWQRARARFGVRLVEAGGAYSFARGTLARGGAVAMMIDQVPQRRRHGVVAPFLGADAWHDKAPAALAARTGAPLVVAAARRSESGAHELFALATLAPPDDAGSAWIEQATRGAAAALEAFVRAHPESWLWMHRRWRVPSERGRVRAS